MTESRPPYHASGGNMEGYDQDGYDANGLDYWGVSREQKQRAFAKLAKRFEEQPDSMAALIAEYRKQEGMSQESLLAKLQITSAQFSHLALCLVPDADANFASDLQKIVDASGANITELADICLQVYAIRALPKRQVVGSTLQPEPAGSPARIRMAMMAARDRDQYAKSVREERADYSPDANAAAATPAPLAAGARPEPDHTAEQTQPPTSPEEAHDPQTPRKENDSPTNS